MLIVDNISKSFIEDEKILNNISFKVNEGELISILGRNGSGKSTLLKILSGIYNLDSGTFSINKNNLTGLPAYKISKYIHYFHQSRENNLPSSLTLLETIMICLSNASKDYCLLNSNSWKQFAIDLIKPIELNLETKLDLQIKNLSGGEFQIFSLILMTELIKVYTNHENILLLDEHTAHLDSNSALKVNNLTIKLVKENQLTTIMITHNIDVALKYSDRIIVLKNGILTSDIDLKSNRYIISKRELEELI